MSLHPFSAEVGAALTPGGEANDLLLFEAHCSPDGLCTEAPHGHAGSDPLVCLQSHALGFTFLTRRM